MSLVDPAQPTVTRVRPGREDTVHQGSGRLTSELLADFAVEPRQVFSGSRR